MATPKELEFLQALAQDRLPQYSSLGALRRVANKLIALRLVRAIHLGDWTRYELTDDGRAVIRPPERRAGPAGPVSRAELDAAVSPVLARIRATAFKPEAEVGETDLLGVLVARYLDHLGSDILAVAEAALTESNMHGTAQEVRGLREDVEGGH